MATVRQAVGAYGERRAVQHLMAAGLTVVQRNWRCSRGEIDIVAEEGETLVFCEVKTRRSEAFGPPAAAVGTAKARRLRRLAAEWLAAHGGGRRDVRFDVIEVRPAERGAAHVEHIRGAF
jgi:putative endonuclease